jgi:hypothetical protein
MKTLRLTEADRKYLDEVSPLGSWYGLLDTLSGCCRCDGSPAYYWSDDGDMLLAVDAGTEAHIRKLIDTDQPERFNRRLVARILEALK